MNTKKTALDRAVTSLLNNISNWKAALTLLIILASFNGFVISQVYQEALDGVLVKDIAINNYISFTLNSKSLWAALSVALLFGLIVNTFKGFIYPCHHNFAGYC